MRLVPPKGGKSEAVPFQTKVTASRRLWDFGLTESEKDSMSEGNGNGDARGANGVRQQDGKGERQSADVRLPNSERVYVEGRTEGVRVPFREVSLQPTRMPDGRVEANEPVRVYDTSGPWGDPEVRCDVRDGLAALRREWILEIGRASCRERV